MANRSIRKAKSASFIALAATLLAVVLAAVFFATRRDEIVFEADPRVSYVHGAFLWEAGIDQPGREYLLAVQKHYVSKYQDLLDGDSSAARGIKRAIDDKVVDQVLANGLYLDWLLHQSGNGGSSADSTTVEAVRLYYLSEVREEPTPSEDSTFLEFGISTEVAEELELDGVALSDIFFPSNAEYIGACAAAEVPIPDRLFDDRDDRWENAGFLAPSILGDFNQLWAYVSEDPEGVCLAFRRFGPADSDACAGRGHFDLICLGLESNKACFFESAGQCNETNLDSPVDIASLLAGDDITVQDPCTECHIGENPFIVHPEHQSFVDALVAKAGIGHPLGWSGTDVYQAFGVSWPPNPPPLDLDKIYSEERCSDCHNQEHWAGRLPDVAMATAAWLEQGDSYPDAYERYCPTVLNGVLGGREDFPATMPLGDPDAPGYDLHKNYLLAMCDEPDQGEVVDNEFEDDPSVLSPPQFALPMYQCAKAVFVNTYVSGAAVEVTINGSVVGIEDPAPKIGPIEFSGFGQLAEGDQVQGRQRVDGNWSELSKPIIVEAHTNDFDELPAPSIDPSTVYACSSVIAVRYPIPGFDLEVRVNDDDPVAGLTYAGYQPIRPGKTPFEIDDEFTAQVSACDDLSAVSDPVLARRPSDQTLTSAVIDPSSLYESQELLRITNLTHGSNFEVIEAGGGSQGGFSTPLSRIRIGLLNPVALSDQLVVAQQLCSFESQPPFTQSPTVLACSVLPAPTIKDPLPGQDFVEVIEPLLGSRVRIYEESGNELGDGTGKVIVLTRPLTEGESVSVTQQIGDCISAEAFKIEV